MRWLVLVVLVAACRGKAAGLPERRSEHAHHSHSHHHPHERDEHHHHPHPHPHLPGQNGHHHPY